MAEGREYPLRRAMATGWDPTNPEAVDPTIGRPMERSYRSGHDHANGEHHRGHGRCRDCVHGQCECPDGQCPLRGLQIERSGLSAFEDAWGNGCGRCSKVRGFLGTVAVVTGWAMAIDSLANDAVSGEDDKTDLIRYDPDSTQPLKAAVAAGIQVV